MDDHPIDLTWATHCCAWQVRCPCGYIRILWWSRDQEDPVTPEAMLAKGWDPFRNLHEGPRGLVTLP